ncbi:response regulator transcription factor [Phytopseudomonas daroniae]|uniref:response regulator transcription factor n=1 Tax=Phytopseudomonas daroniae TaxID=2487519 RepID=UPI0010385AB1|nr:helix-turn-helix domain-containing protein [Pseudomonas daroniae]TBU71238.1 DNA-binding response regulator [Pseudomonas daroniae]
MQNGFITAPHILVIDDSPEELRGLIGLLRQQSWRLSLASDAHQGYQRALALKPDLILLDVRMPGMDGFTLCRLLREAPATRRVPVIFLTSAGAVDERLEGLTLGGVDYVLKSCEPQEVLARIRIHLQLAWRETSLGAVPSADVEPATDAEVLLRAAMRLIAQHLDDMPSLAEIARKVGTHDKRLSGIFREHLGMTVFAYIREVRLKQGLELLANSGMSIQDIAELVGFRSACNFTTAFRERMGMTPSQFRQQERAQT